jgi:hypothetical protein
MCVGFIIINGGNIMKAFRIDIAEGGFVIRELHANRDKRNMAAAKNYKAVIKTVKQWLKKMK